MKNILILFYLLFAALYGQWALWGNPSLPGGSSDKGLGANKNEIFYSLTQSTQYIDWWHAPVPEENFEHKGILITSIIRPGLIYGLGSKVNLSASTTLGLRSMSFNKDNESVHHRDEHSASDFDNAEGGILGDSRIILRYLLKNTGAGDGYRIILGSGITLPSKNNLTKSPFLESDEGFILNQLHTSLCSYFFKMFFGFYSAKQRFWLFPFFDLSDHRISITYTISKCLIEF